MSIKRLTRREFLRIAGITSAGLVAAACAPSVAPTQAPGATTAAQPTSGPQPTAVPQATAGPRYGGVLRISDIADGISIGYPAKLVRATSNRQTAPVVETLLRVDRAGNLTPWLAMGFANDVAAKAITLTLRKGVKFHDGTDFNAEAVKWNLEACVAAKQQGSEKIKSVDAVDDSTVRVSLTEWDSTVASSFPQALGLMVSPTATKKNGADWAAKNPVGTGPFQFVSWEKDVRIAYKKFDRYWQKGKPYLDRVEFTNIADSVTRQLALRKGEIDLALGISPQDILQLGKDGFVVTRVLGGSGAYTLIPDSANPQSPWADVRVRQAAQYAIDTAEIVKSILLGQAEPASQWIYKGHWGYNSSVVGYPYNPTKAKQLLSEAGYANGFKTKILYQVGTGDQVCNAVQGYLSAVGIDVQLDPAQPTRWNEATLGGGKWEGLVWGSMTGDPDVVAQLALRYTGGGKWYSQLKLPDDFVGAIKSAVSAPDTETKQKWAQEAEKLMVDKHCMQLTLYATAEAIVSQPKLQNHGWFETPNKGLWRPEDAWLEA